MEIKKEADKVLQELSSALGEIDLKETYYVVGEINVTREDGEPKKDETFVKMIQKNAPKIADDGCYVMEVGRWVE